MQAVLLFIFIFLYFFNYDICSRFFDPYEQTQEWYYLRDRLYEGMFFIAVLASKFKRTLLSKALSIFGLVLIGFCIIDKYFLDVYLLTDRDYFIIIPLAVSAGYIYYEKRNK